MPVGSFGPAMQVGRSAFSGTDGSAKPLRLRLTGRVATPAAPRCRNLRLAVPFRSFFVFSQNNCHRNAQHQVTEGQLLAIVL
jgi:hypothetical protein